MVPYVDRRSVHSASMLGGPIARFSRVRCSPSSSVEVRPPWPAETVIFVRAFHSFRTYEQKVGGSSPTAPTLWNVRAVVRACVLVFWRYERHNGAMPSVQIKDVPEEAHAVLRRRAADAHQSLQEYLRSRLIAEASRPTLGEVLDRAGGRAGGSVTLKAAARAVRDDRARR